MNACIIGIYMTKKLQAVMPQLDAINSRLYALKFQYMKLKDMHFCN